MTNQSTKQKIALVMDQTSRSEFFEQVDPLEAHPALVLKLGLRLLPHLSREDLQTLKQKDFSLFIDVKLHDIPSQVADSVKTWAGLGADYITVHLSGGRAMLEKAQKHAEASRVTLLGVSVLTSLDAADLEEVGVRDTVGEQVKRLIQLGLDCGLESFVCSAQEIDSLKRDFPMVNLVTPGMTLDTATQTAGEDQKRHMSVHEALEKGSFMPVLGRSLWGQEKPADELKKLLSQLS